MQHNENGPRDSVQVIFGFEGEPPNCDHGPMLLFQRNSIIDKRFFACSAYRDRKLCPAYVLETEWKKEKSNKVLKENPLVLQSHKLNTIREHFVDNKIFKPEKSSFCHSCGELFSECSKQHLNHKVTKEVNNSLLQNPSQLLDPLDHSKKEAQYFFSDNSIRLILALLEDAKVSHILCIACPTIFERLKQTGSKKCLMLDLDVRFRQFYGHQEYLLYNMFNHHMFDRTSGVYEQFLKDGKHSLALVMDPPFGGKVEVISQTLKKIDADYKRVNRLTSLNISKFWIFPYFMESQIVFHQPDFAMLDYKVEYVNHIQFQKGPKGRKQGSPVRIFTNINLQQLRLPASEGYRFCNICKKWISLENRHCADCNSCTSKDGRTYVHCVECNRCVKPTWVHCRKCNRCALIDHPCKLFQERSTDILQPSKKKKVDPVFEDCTASIKSTSNNWTAIKLI